MGTAPAVIQQTHSINPQCSWKFVLMDDSKKLHWEPLVSVGSFKFDDLIQKYIDQYDLRFIEAANELLNWDRYSTPDKNVYIDTEDSRIVAISCYEHFFYKEKNLIGLSLDEIRTLLFRS